MPTGPEPSGLEASSVLLGQRHGDECKHTSAFMTIPHNYSLNHLSQRACREYGPAKRALWAVWCSVALTVLAGCDGGNPVDGWWV
jgi:hypothetical protein